MRKRQQEALIIIEVSDAGNTVRMFCLQNI